MNRLEGRLLSAFGVIAFWFGGPPLWALAMGNHQPDAIQFSPWLLGGGVLVACLGELIRTITAEEFFLCSIFGGMGLTAIAVVIFAFVPDLFVWGWASLAMGLTLEFWSMPRLDRILLAKPATQSVR